MGIVLILYISTEPRSKIKDKQITHHREIHPHLEIRGLRQGNQYKSVNSRERVAVVQTSDEVHKYEK